GSRVLTPASGNNTFCGLDTATSCPPARTSSCSLDAMLRIYNESSENGVGWIFSRSALILRKSTRPHFPHELLPRCSVERLDQLDLSGVIEVVRDDAGDDLVDGAAAGRPDERLRSERRNRGAELAVAVLEQREIAFPQRRVTVPPCEPVRALQGKRVPLPAGEPACHRV